MGTEKIMGMLDRVYDCGYYDRNTKDYDPRGSKAYDEVLSHIVELEHEKGVLVESIAKLAVEAGVINEGTGISGPQALMLLQDLSISLAA